MPYNPTTWSNGSTPLSAANLNNIETQYTQATTSFEQDLFSPFVLYGLVASKDGTTANQLDVTAGVAFVSQADNTLQRIAPSASTGGQFLTSSPNSTYQLNLHPAGSWFFGGIDSGAYVTIAQVTTDGSGNILTVTDKRNLYANALPKSAGAFSFGQPTSGGASVDMMGTYVSVGPSQPTAPTATPVSGSGLSQGNYGYKVTWLSLSGESFLGLAGTCTTTSSNKKVNLTNISTGPTGTNKRNIYRTQVGGSTYFFLATIADNTTTTYTDTTADASLVTAASAHQTLAGSFWTNSSNTTLAAIYGDGAFMCDTGMITSNGAGTLTLSSGSLVATSSTNGIAAVSGLLPSTPGADQGVVQASVTGDSQRRSALYIRSSDGYGGLRGGAGSSLTAHLYAQSTGWQIDEALAVTGAITSGSYFAGAQSGTAPATASSGTIATAGLTLSRVSPTGAVTSVVLQAGTVAGQEVVVVNEATSANSITFAASGTSHVADGTSDVIAGLVARCFVWDSGTSLWYHCA